MDCRRAIASKQYSLPDSPAGQAKVNFGFHATKQSSIALTPNRPFMIIPHVCYNHVLAHLFSIREITWRKHAQNMFARTAATSRQKGLVAAPIAVNSTRWLKKLSRWQSLPNKIANRLA